MNFPTTMTINASSWSRVTKERDEAREECLEMRKLLAESANDLALARKLAESAMLESDRLRAQLHKEQP